MILGTSRNQPRCDKEPSIEMLGFLCVKRHVKLGFEASICPFVMCSRLDPLGIGSDSPPAARRQAGAGRRGSAAGGQPTRRARGTTAAQARRRQASRVPGDSLQYFRGFWVTDVWDRDHTSVTMNYCRGITSLESARRRHAG